MTRKKGFSVIELVIVVVIIAIIAAIAVPRMSAESPQSFFPLGDKIVSATIDDMMAQRSKFEGLPAEDVKKLLLERYPVGNPLRAQLDGMSAEAVKTAAIAQLRERLKKRNVHYLKDDEPPMGTTDKK